MTTNTEHPNEAGEAGEAAESTNSANFDPIPAGLRSAMEALQAEAEADGPGGAGGGDGGDGEVEVRVDEPAATEVSEAPEVPVTEVTEEAPEATQVTEQAPAATEQPQQPEATSTTPADFTYDFTLDGQTLSVGRDHIDTGLNLLAWSEGLTDADRSAINGVTSGAAIAVPRAEYEAFEAWRDSQARASRDADLDDLRDYNPALADKIAAEREAYAKQQPQGQYQPQGQPQPQDAPADWTPESQSQANAELSRRERVALEVQSNYGTAHGLTAEQTEAILRTAADAGIVPHLMQQGTTRHPVTGQPVPPDWAAVVAGAMDWGLAQHPDLYVAAYNHAQGQQQVTSTPTAPATPAAPATSASATPDPPEDALTAMKARAGSVASAPSANSTPTPRNISAMTDDEVAAEMAKFLQAAKG